MRVISPLVASARSKPSHLLLRNDPLDVVWRETETGWSSSKSQVRCCRDIIVSHQRFIATMQGRTASFSTFSHTQFDEATFEAQFAGDGKPMTICWYWIIKLKARFLSGDYAEALAAADKRSNCSGLCGIIQLIDYFYYAALMVSAVYETASPIGSMRGANSRRRIGNKCANGPKYPPTFADKHALVFAEIARLEKRDDDAQRLYEQAIHLARENGFVQNEGLSHELAAHTA